MSSPLADTFTSAEREAVNKFKEDYLERALSEAGGDESTTVKIWNVPMTVTEEDSRVDLVLVKFLRAKYQPLTLLFSYKDLNFSNLLLPETHTQFVKTLKWIREFDPKKAANETHDAVYDTVGYVLGKDKRGRIITYNLYGGLDNEAVSSCFCFATNSFCRYLEMSISSFGGVLD